MKDRGAFGFSKDAFTDHELDQADHGDPFVAAMVSLGLESVGVNRGLLRRVFVGIVVRVRMVTGDFGDPFIEGQALLRFLFFEGNAHAEAGLGIDHVAGSLEICFALLQGDADFGADRERYGGIDEAAAGTEIHGAGGEARAGLQFDDFSGGGEHMTLSDAAFSFLSLFRLAVAVDVSVLFSDRGVHSFSF